MGREIEIARRWLIKAIVLVMIQGLAITASAATIVPFLVDLKKTEKDVKLAGGGTADIGISQGYLDRNPANIFTFFTDTDKFNGTPTLGEENFAVAFKNWNGANGDKWRLVDGGSLDITLLVAAQATINAAKTGGGLTLDIIGVEYKPKEGGPTLGQLGFAQAVVANFQPGVAGEIKPPVVTMDTFSTQNRPGKPTDIPPGPDAKNNTKPSDLPEQKEPGYADPLYPFLIKDLTNPDKLVYGTADAASGPFPYASFRAIMLISTVTLQTDADGKVTDRILTVYDGVSWGFDLSVASVPEPTSALLAVGLAVGLLVASRRNRAGWGRRTAS